MNKSVFYSVFTAVLVSTLISGCRFGNHADEPQPLKNDNQTAEFFYSAAQYMETTVRLNSIGGPDTVVNTNHAAPHALIPALIREALSTPVFYFVTYKDGSRNPFFADYTYSSGMGTKIDANGDIAYIGTSEVDYLWNNTACLTQYEITHEGNFDRSHATEIVYSDGTKAPVGGSVNLTYTYTRVIDGDCSADLTYLANCYTNGAGCSPRAIDTAITIFDIYKQSGVLNMSDATKIKSLEYKVRYE